MTYQAALAQYRRAKRAVSSFPSDPDGCFEDEFDELASQQHDRLMSLFHTPAPDLRAVIYKLRELRRVTCPAHEDRDRINALIADLLRIDGRTHRADS
jgi:hypothetical protein